MPALLAAAPIAVVLLGMGLLRWPAMVAGGAGLVTAVVIALTAFDLGAGPGVEEDQAAIGAAAEALHATAVILWILVPALAVYELQRRSGGIDLIREALAGVTSDRRLQALLIAWFFGLFMEGAAGFGTPVALTAPLLVGIGFTPVRAVALALIGHAAGVSFGAVGTPVLTQVEITGLDGRDIATAAAGIHALIGVIFLVVLVRLAGDGPLTQSDAMWTALAGVCFFVPSVALAALVGPELPTLGGALVGGAVFVALLWRRRSRENLGANTDPGYGENPGENPGGSAGVDRSGTVGDTLVSARSLAAVLAPYLVIVGIVLVTRLIPGLRETLTAVSFDWQLFGVFSATFEPLFQPGSILLAGLVVGAVVTGRARHLGPSLGLSIVRLAPVAVTLLAMLGLSRVMVNSGMIATLADAAAQTSAVWPVLAPAVGVLGTFVTGSATASNILFTEFQLSTAAALALPPVLMAAAQAVGAAVGNVVAPHNIVAGSATVGVQGREGEVLSRTVGACVLYSAAAGVVVLVAAQLL